MMFAAMAAMAFFVDDVRRLASMALHYLPQGTPIARLTQAAFDAYDAGLSLRDARDRLMLLDGVPEACDAQINVPFTFLGLLYGENDLQETLLSALRCGYDTDCTLATSGALIGQLLGASRIPAALKAQIGDDLVMGIEYRRPEMTLSALARDTARVGVLLSTACDTGVTIESSPDLAPFPEVDTPAVQLSVEYEGLPAAAPGETVHVTVHVAGDLPEDAILRVDGPDGWTIVPQSAPMDTVRRDVQVALRAPSHVTTWPQRHQFTARVADAAFSFGVAGAGLWKFLGVYYDAVPDPDDPLQKQRAFNQHFISLDKPYLPEPNVDVEALFQQWSQTLGHPALVPAYEHEIDLTRLVGLRGPYCAYLARTIISPEARKVWLVIGNNDAYRLYLNGELIAGVDEVVWWAPFNNTHLVELCEGENHILLKLLKRGDEVQFTFGVREYGEQRPGHNTQDWLVDLEDVA